MNKVTSQKYASYRLIASEVEKQISELNEKCKYFINFLTIIIYIYIYI